MVGSLLVIPSVFIFVPASPVYASIANFFNSFFKTPVPATTKIYNSQNIPLLQAAINSDPMANTGGAVLLVDNSALVSQDSPAGGLAENVQDTPSSDQISIYVVREGDTLSSIAQMFNVSVNTIRWANDIKGSTLSVGETLTILPISGVRHTVKKGDTVKSIAKEYNANVDDILSYNNISADEHLNAGDVVIVPDGEMSTSSYSSSSSRNSSGLTEPILFVPTNIKVSAGYFLRPVSGPLTQGLHGYNAVDLGSPVGTPILAAADGTVIVSRNNGGWNGGYGNYVVIQHPNGTQTLYAHAEKTIVYVGEYVSRGQTIAYVGMTGKTTGPHVHFEVRGTKNPFAK